MLSGDHPEIAGAVASAEIIHRLAVKSFPNNVMMKSCFSLHLVNEASITRRRVWCEIGVEDAILIGRMPNGQSFAVEFCFDAKPGFFIIRSDGPVVLPNRRDRTPPMRSSTSSQAADPPLRRPGSKNH